MRSFYGSSFSCFWELWTLFSTVIVSASAAGDKYNEELLFSRLPTNALLANFRFTIDSEAEKLGPDYHMFPRLLAEMIKNHDIAELELAFTQGRWRHDEWGLQPQPATPTGAHLTAWLYGKNETSIDSEFNVLVDALNGIFCSSISSISKHLTITTKEALKMRGNAKKEPNKLLRVRYGAVPEESLCTENLTPWRKFLPCKSDGLISLLNPYSIYAQAYSSMGLSAIRICKNKACHWRLNSYISIVFDTSLETLEGGILFETLFKRDLAGRCRVAESSRLLIRKGNDEIEFHPSNFTTIGKGLHSYAVYDLKDENLDVRNLEFTYKNIDPKRLPIAINIYTVQGGIDQQTGTMRTRIINADRTSKTVSLLQILPWFVRIYYDTIQMRCNLLGGTQELVTPSILSKHFTESTIRQHPSVMEWRFVMLHESICEFEFKFDKAHMRIWDYPPDANHGMYVAAARLLLDDAEGTLTEYRAAVGDYIRTASEELKSSAPITAYTFFSNPVLISLPVPDFSMPFNVVCFVLTVMSFCITPMVRFATKLMIITNGVQLEDGKSGKYVRFVLLALVGLALYAQYYELTTSDIRRQLAELFEKLNDMSR